MTITSELMTDGTESVMTAFGIGIDSNSSVLELSISPYPFRFYHARLSKSSLQQPYMPASLPSTAKLNRTSVLG